MRKNGNSDAAVTLWRFCLTLLSCVKLAADAHSADQLPNGNCRWRFTSHKTQ